MENIITWYAWWEIIIRKKDKKDIVIRPRETKEFSDPKAMTRFEQKKIESGYDTGHGYWLNIP